MNFIQALPKVPRVHGRHAYVLARCAGKRVLHIGCVDSGILAERFARGELMHQRLAAVTTELWGVDVDGDGIAFLTASGVPNLIVADAAHVGEVPELTNRTFDVIVASELVEHLSNPGLFLDSVRRLMTPGRTELVLSVPNAFKYGTLAGLLRGHELVHPDHNCYFSYYTFGNLLRKHGFDVVDGAMYQFLLPDRRRTGATGSNWVGRGLGDAPSRRTAMVTGPAGSAAPGLPARRSIGARVRGRLARLDRLPERTAGRILLRLSPFFSDGILMTVRVAR